MSSARSAIDIRMPARSQTETKDRLSPAFKFTIVFTLLHLPLGILLSKIGVAGAVHPLAAFALGLYWAFKPAVRLERVSLVCLYIIASEVLWRMADLPVWWEFGKYSVSIIMVLALFRRRIFSVPPAPVAYLLFLLPSCILTLVSYEPEYARILLSFNMSGPLVLAVACWFFSHTKFRRPEIKRMFVVAMAPFISVAVTTLFFTVSNPNIEFSLESNTATSGGFGPNQVSSMLGLGAFIAVALLLLFKQSSKEKIFFGVAGLFLAAQSVMTFSRGGMYNAVGALVLLFFFLVKDVRAFFRQVIPPAAVTVIFLFVVFPVLNNYTGGALEQRFQSTESTNRVEIIESDLQILAENPIFGVGVGVARGYREKFLEFSSASHTEFSRLISEHGIFGFGAMACLLIMAVSGIKGEKQGFGRALKAGVIMWCFLFMLNAGMRLAAPSVLFGLSLTTLVPAYAPLRRMLRRRRPAKVRPAKVRPVNKTSSLPI